MKYIISERWSERTAELVAEDGAIYPEDNALRIFDVDFTVLPSRIESIPHIARDVKGIPNLWDLHPYNEWTYVQKLSARQVGPHTVEVTVEYKTIENPIDRPPEIEFLSAVSTEPVDKAFDPDGNDIPITNSSGELFDPPITKDFRDLILRAKRYQLEFDKAQASSFEGSINSQTVWGYEPGTVRCNIYNSKELRFGGLWMYEVTFEFQVREDGWKRRILDQGFREKTGIDSVTGKPTYAIIKDEKDNPLSQPALLDGAGSILADTAPPEFKEFELVNRNDFTVLGLD